MARDTQVFYIDSLDREGVQLLSDEDYENLHLK